MDSFKGWGAYLKVALPSAFLFSAEWISVEVMAFITIFTGKLNYTVHVIIDNIGLNIFTVPYGFGITASSISGNFICTKSNAYIKKYLKIVYIAGLSLLGVVLSFTYIFRVEILNFYTDQLDVIDLGKETIAFLCLQKIGDFLCSVTFGILRGFRRQEFATKITFVNYYIIQIIFGIILGKVFEMGVRGVWIGMTIGSSALSICLFGIIKDFNLSEIREEIFLAIHCDLMTLNYQTNSEYDDKLMIELIEE